MKFLILCTVPISIFIFVISQFFAHKLRLLDYPNFRKKHKKATPYTGGLGLAIIFVIIIYISDFEEKNISHILSYSFLIAIIGLIDDKINLNAGNKLILQLLLIILLMNEGFYLTNLGFMPFIGIIKLGSFSNVFTILCCMFFINAYNYVDGIDGLATSISIIIIVTLLLYMGNFNTDLFRYSILIIIPLLIFLLFNISFLSLPKIFLGDSGSILLGFFISFYAIILSEKYDLKPSLIIWPLGYIVFEFLSTTILRIVNKKSIFRAGRDHFHYEIKKIIKTDFLVLLSIVSINIFLNIYGYLINLYTNNLISVFSYTCVFLMFLFVRYKYLYKKD